jgi:hypothetical protein
MTYEIVDAGVRKKRKKRALQGLIGCTQFMVFCSIVDGSFGTLIIAEGKFTSMQQMQFYVRDEKLFH